MSSPDQYEAECKSCGEQEELRWVALAKDEGDVDGEFTYTEDSVMWLCERHYTKLLKHQDYRIRELSDPVQIDHNLREENDDGSVTILKENNENKWLKVPEELELDLQHEI